MDNAPTGGIPAEAAPEILTDEALKNRKVGHCRLLRKLGQGGMGAVWLARHETLEKEVAVKILPSSIDSDLEALPRFLREARSAARLEHPNIVQVLDAGSDGPVHFIVMQLVDGTDLEKIVKKKGRCSVPDALAIGKRVALALSAAHAMGIVHRDIKPANLMLTKQGRVMVTDFGLAREVIGGASITNAAEAIGTPQYLAPEQARGEPVDGRSDLYSLGGTLYTLLSGKTPYTGSSPVVIALKHASADEKPVPLRQIVPDIPPEVEALVEQLMSKKPADRIPTGEEVARRIDAIKSAQGSPISTAHEKVSTPGRSRRVVIAGLCGVAALAAVIGFVALPGPDPDEKAFREAGAAMTDADKVGRYLDVAAHFPGSPRGNEARKLATVLRDGMLRRELDTIRLAALGGSLAMRDQVSRLELLTGTYPEGKKEIDGMELTLHRDRVIARTRSIAEVLRMHKPDDKGERFKEYVAPEALKKIGEGWVPLEIRLALGGFAGEKMRIEDLEVAQDHVKEESRKEAVVPVKATVVIGKSRERSTHKVTVRWIWQEGDWYLAEKGIQQEK
jgi:hypothetical protein